MKVQQIIEHFSTLPMASFNTIAPGTSLILAPHSDDESLGCAGLIATAVQHDRPPVVVIVSDGSASHPASHAWPPERLALCRQEESRNAAAVLGLAVDRLLFLGLRDSAVPSAGIVFENVVQSYVCLCTSIISRIFLYRGAMILIVIMWLYGAWGKD